MDKFSTTEMLTFFRNAKNAVQNPILKNVTGYFPSGKFYNVGELNKIAKSWGQWRGQSETAITVQKTCDGWGIAGFPAPVHTVDQSDEYEDERVHYHVELADMEVGSTAMTYRLLFREEMEVPSVIFLVHRVSKTTFYVVWYWRFRSHYETAPTF